MHRKYWKNHLARHGRILAKSQLFHQIDGILPYRWRPIFKAMGSFQHSKCHPFYQNTNIGSQSHWQNHVIICQFDCEPIALPRHRFHWKQTAIEYRRFINPRTIFQKMQRLIAKAIDAIKSVAIKFTRKAHISRPTNEHTQVRFNANIKSKHQYLWSKSMFLRRWKALCMHMDRMWLAFRPFRWADSTFPKTHRHQTIPLPTLYQVFQSLRPSAAAHATTLTIGSQHHQ